MDLAGRRTKTSMPNRHCVGSIGLLEHIFRMRTLSFPTVRTRLFGAQTILVLNWSSRAQKAVAAGPTSPRPAGITRASGRPTRMQFEALLGWRPDEIIRVVRAAGERTLSTRIDQREVANDEQREVGCASDPARAPRDDRHPRYNLHPLHDRNFATT